MIFELETKNYAKRAIKVLGSFPILLNFPLFQIYFSKDCRNTAKLYEEVLVEENNSMKILSFISVFVMVKCDIQNSCFEIYIYTLIYTLYTLYFNIL